MMIRLHICPSHNTPSGQRFTVIDLATGTPIVQSARDPEGEACRALVEQGVTGQFVSYVGNSAHPSFKPRDITKRALRTISEGQNTPIRNIPWTPTPDLSETGTPAEKTPAPVCLFSPPAAI